MGSGRWKKDLELFSVERAAHYVISNIKYKITNPIIIKNPWRCTDRLGNAGKR
ncbi:hypothetical protein HNP69_002006 [Chryseobacterium koreense]|nr:hypothetical protein [Chryseobacterium koreense]